MSLCLFGLSKVAFQVLKEHLDELRVSMMTCPVKHRHFVRFLYNIDVSTEIQQIFSLRII